MRLPLSSAILIILLSLNQAVHLHQKEHQSNQQKLYHTQKYNIKNILNVDRFMNRKKSGMKLAQVQGIDD
jgi:hypothetical protein